MTKKCSNPECPVHGDTPEAIRDRNFRQLLVTNHEAMMAVRVMAANVHSSILDGGDIPEGPMERFYQAEIIRGNKDDDYVVQGLLAGMIVLLRDHYPTQQMVGLCAAIPESESIFTKLLEEDTNQEPPGFDVVTLEEFLAMLAGMGRRKRSH
jgi:hypothetical protein